jgi:hypothetical protein
VVCGRTITWRAKWARDWAEVKYCSDRCRTHGRGGTAQRLETAITDLLTARAGGATICPSEAARASSMRGRHFSPPTARAAARRLVAAGRVEITQGGRVVDPSTAKGPIRIRRTPQG